MEGQDEAANASDAQTRSLWQRIAGKGPERAKKSRPHPFAHEQDGELEKAMDPTRVTALWFGLATVVLFAGLLLSYRYSNYGDDGPALMVGLTALLAKVFLMERSPNMLWEQWTLVPLFAGLVLLGFGFFRQTWSKRLTLAGWILFGFYWSLTATDLYASEDEDIVNYIFALVGAYFFTYLAYQNWLDLSRRSDTQALHFLNVTAFVAAGTYFVIAKITFLRLWLIHIVGNHTKWMLDLFGQGDKANIQFVVDKTDTTGPVTFFYPDYYCEASGARNDLIGQYCAEHGLDNIRTFFPEPSTWFEHMMFYKAEAQGVVPVSIILACTAIQSIMLFVGLFAGTEAHWKKKLQMSVIVGAIIYVLNLVRNTGIIWFFGQGHASFWTMHNAIGKGGSLLAMIGIAFAVFRYFPEFFKSLSEVLDLPDRDGPIEQTFKLGRRRPQAMPVAAEE